MCVCDTVLGGLQADMHAQHLLYYKGSLSDWKNQGVATGSDEMHAQVCLSKEPYKQPK